MRLRLRWPKTAHTADNPAGAQSPYGEDHEFPLRPEKLRYVHPTRRREEDEDDRR